MLVVVYLKEWTFKILDFCFPVNLQLLTILYYVIFVIIKIKVVLFDMKNQFAKNADHSNQEFSFGDFYICLILCFLNATKLTATNF